MGTIIGAAAGGVALAIVASVLLSDEIRVANGASDLLREVGRLIPGADTRPRGGMSLPLKLTAAVGAGLIVAAFVGGVL